MVKCPINCDPNYIIRVVNRDTCNSEAYYCLACGKLFYLFIHKDVK